MRRVSGIALWLVSGSMAMAAGFSPKSADVCVPEAGTSTFVVSPQKLMGHLIDDQGIKAIDIDDNNDFALTYGNQIKAVFDPDAVCGAACGDKERAKLLSAQGALENFLRLNGGGAAPGKSGFQVVPPIEQDDSPGLSRRLESYFHGARPFKIYCVGYGKVASGGGSGGTASTPAPKFSLRIRKNITDLDIDQSDKVAFKGVERASFSVNADYLAHSDSYSVDALIGLSTGKVYIDPNSYEFVPFVGYQQQYVAGNNPKKIDAVQNLSAGFLNDATFRLPDGSYNSWQLYPEFVHSLRSHADVVSGNLVYSPDVPVAFQYLFPFIGQQWNPLQQPYFAMRLDPSLHVVYGRVLDHGSDPTLVDPALEQLNNYGRIGPRLVLNIYGESIFSGYSATVSYEYQKVFSGPMYGFGRLETSLNYSLPSGGSTPVADWALQLKYIQGRDLDTLEKQQLLTLGLGLRF